MGSSQPSEVPNHTQQPNNTSVAMTIGMPDEIPITGDNKISTGTTLIGNAKKNDEHPPLAITYETYHQPENQKLKNIKSVFLERIMHDHTVDTFVETPYDPLLSDGSKIERKDEELIRMHQEQANSSQRLIPDFPFLNAEVGAREQQIFDWVSSLFRYERSLLDLESNLRAERGRHQWGVKDEDLHDCEENLRCREKDFAHRQALFQNFGVDFLDLDHMFRKHANDNNWKLDIRADAENVAHRLETPNRIAQNKGTMPQQLPVSQEALSPSGQGLDAHSLGLQDTQRFGYHNRSSTHQTEYQDSEPKLDAADSNENTGHEDPATRHYEFEAHDYRSQFREPASQVFSQHNQASSDSIKHQKSRIWSHFKTSTYQQQRRVRYEPQGLATQRFRKFRVGSDRKEEGTSDQFQLLSTQQEVTNPLNQVHVIQDSGFESQNRTLQHNGLNFPMDYQELSSEAQEPVQHGHQDQQPACQNFDSRNPESEIQSIGIGLHMESQEPRAGDTNFGFAPQTLKAHHSVVKLQMEHQTSTNPHVGLDQEGRDSVIGSQELQRTYTQEYALQDQETSERMEYDFAEAQSYNFPEAQACETTGLAFQSWYQHIGQCPVPISSPAQPQLCLDGANQQMPFSSPASEFPGLPLCPNRPMPQGENPKYQELYPVRHASYDQPGYPNQRIVYDYQDDQNVTTQFSNRGMSSRTQESKNGHYAHREHSPPKDLSPSYDSSFENHSESTSSFEQEPIEQDQLDEFRRTWFVDDSYSREIKSVASSRNTSISEDSNNNRKRHSESSDSSPTSGRKRRRIKKDSPQKEKNREYTKKYSDKRKAEQKEAEEQAQRNLMELRELQYINKQKEKYLNISLTIFAPSESVEELKQYGLDRGHVNIQFDKLKSSDQFIIDAKVNMENAKVEFDKASDDYKAKKSNAGTLGGKKSRALENFKLRLNEYHSLVYKHDLSRELQISSHLDNLLRAAIPNPDQLLQTISNQMHSEIINNGITIQEFEELQEFVRQNRCLFVK